MKGRQTSTKSSPAAKTKGPAKPKARRRTATPPEQPKRTRSSKKQQSPTHGCPSQLQSTDLDNHNSSTLACTPNNSQSPQNHFNFLVLDPAMLTQQQPAYTPTKSVHKHSRPPPRSTEPVVITNVVHAITITNAPTHTPALTSQTQPSDAILPAIQATGFPPISSNCVTAPRRNNSTSSTDPTQASASAARGAGVPPLPDDKPSNGTCPPPSGLSSSPSSTMNMRTIHTAAGTQPPPAAEPLSTQQLLRQYVQCHPGHSTRAVAMAHAGLTPIHDNPLDLLAVTCAELVHGEQQHWSLAGFHGGADMGPPLRDSSACQGPLGLVSNSTTLSMMDAHHDASRIVNAHSSGQLRMSHASGHMLSGNPAGPTAMHMWQSYLHDASGAAVDAVQEQALQLWGIKDVAPSGGDHHDDPQQAPYHHQQPLHPGMWPGLSYMVPAITGYDFDALLAANEPDNTATVQAQMMGAVQCGDMSEPRHHLTGEGGALPQLLFMHKQGGIGLFASKDNVMKRMTSDGNAGRGVPYSALDTLEISCWKLPNNPLYDGKPGCTAVPPYTAMATPNDIPPQWQHYALEAATTDPFCPPIPSQLHPYLNSPPVRPELDVRPAMEFVDTAMSSTQRDVPPAASYNRHVPPSPAEFCPFKPNTTPSTRLIRRNPSKSASSDLQNCESPPPPVNIVGRLQSNCKARTSSTAPRTTPADTTNAPFTPHTRTTLIAHATLSTQAIKLEPLEEEQHQQLRFVDPRTLSTQAMKLEPLEEEQHQQLRFVDPRFYCPTASSRDTSSTAMHTGQMSVTAAALCCSSSSLGPTEDCASPDRLAAALDDYIQGRNERVAVEVNEGVRYEYMSDMREMEREWRERMRVRWAWIDRT